MGSIVITDSNEFEMVIKGLEESLTRLHGIFTHEDQNMRIIDDTDVWSGKTQQVITTKYNELRENFEPIEQSLGIYINFLKNALADYKKIESQFSSAINVNDSNLDVKE